MKRNFPFYKQLDAKDCGATCVKIILKYYKNNVPIQEIRNKLETDKQGSSLYNISKYFEEIGFRTLGAKLTIGKLNQAPRPLILHWNQKHYVVLYKVKKDSYYISDPAHGLIRYSKTELLQSWIGKDSKSTQEGIVLLLETTPKFHDYDFDDSKNSIDFEYLKIYLHRYRKFLWQLVAGLVGASLLQLIFPFLTQSVVDVGIKNQNVHFIYLVLIAQLALFIGKSAIEVIRGWILLHLSTRINISLISDFFIKLMRLPIAFFDTRLTGDIIQRINDHKRIERIMTTSSLSVLFSMVNLLIFGFVLAIYSISIFGIFLVGTIFYFLWIIFFLKQRAALDYKRFSQISQEQSKVIELINGMQTIKLNNAERQKRWSWEEVRVQLFNISIDGLALEQYQTVGSNFINELKNILITILSAKLVIDGNITLGMMLAISYIVGQLNSPVSQLIGFIRELQDAKISLMRLAEIHNQEDEGFEIHEKITEFDTSSDISIESVTFRYIGGKRPVLEGISLHIPAKKITAIVGTSGSGKTTLLKILLKFYSPENGIIKLGDNEFENIDPERWRRSCGVVMQEDYIFNDTIANNIALGDGNVDAKRLRYASEIANIESFIETLPLKYKTKIGMEGSGLSTGQKQRILIARAVYKNPEFIFLDEATSALDANNETVIMSRLNEFFRSKTVLIIAHRLSTVKNADQIVVLDNGKITELGNHNTLIKNKGPYYNLIKNQLELGN